jgi:hypothetical protein
MDHAVQTLLDKQAIYELSCRYMRGLDRLDADSLLSVFWEDAYCEYGFINGDAPTFIVFAISALRDHAANQHMIGNTLIEMEGDEAFGEVYFHAYHKVKSDIGFDDLIVAGRYLDRYECRNGVWKMAYRSERVDWSRTTPTNDPYYDRGATKSRSSGLLERVKNWRPFDSCYSCTIVQLCTNECSRNPKNSRLSQGPG